MYRLSVLFFLLAQPFFAMAQTITAVTYNVRYDNPGDGENAWPKRRGVLMQQLTAFQADLIGTQEALLHQVQALDSLLTGYVRIGRGRDDGADKGEFSPLYVNTRVFEVKSSGMNWLSETPEVPSRGWDAMLNRVVAWAELTHRPTGKLVFVMNTHFDHLGETARLKSAEFLAGQAGAWQKKGAVVVVMGDFNAVPDAPPVRVLSTVLTDTRQLAAKRIETVPGTFNGFNAAVTARERIDYIWLAPAKTTVKRYEVPVLVTSGRYPSDHFPVVVTFSL